MYYRCFFYRQSILVFGLRQWLTIDDAPGVLAPAYPLAANFEHGVGGHHSKRCGCLQLTVLLLELLVLVTVALRELVYLDNRLHHWCNYKVQTKCGEHSIGIAQLSRTRSQGRIKGRLTRIITSPPGRVQNLGGSLIKIIKMFLYIFVAIYILCKYPQYLIYL